MRDTDMRATLMADFAAAAKQSEQRMKDTQKNIVYYAGEEAAAYATSVAAEVMIFNQIRLTTILLAHVYMDDAAGGVEQAMEGANNKFMDLKKLQSRLALLRITNDKNKAEVVHRMIGEHVEKDSRLLAQAMVDAIKKMHELQAAAKEAVKH